MYWNTLIKDTHLKFETLNVIIVTVVILTAVTFKLHTYYLNTHILYTSFVDKCLKYDVFKIADFPSLHTEIIRTH